MATMQDLANILGVNIGEEFFISNKDYEEAYIISPTEKK